MNRPSSLKKQNCRNLLCSSRARRQVMAERFTQQWREILRHATIERDAVKLASLAAESEKRKRQEASAQRKS
jgi:hypothetical protein